MRPNRLVTALVVKEGDAYVGLCCEHDIVTQANSLPALRRGLASLLEAYEGWRVTEGTAPPAAMESSLSRRYTGAETEADQEWGVAPHPIIARLKLRWPTTKQRFRKTRHWVNRDMMLESFSYGHPERWTPAPERRTAGEGT